MVRLVKSIVQYLHNRRKNNAYISTTHGKISGADAFIWAAMHRPTIASIIKTYSNHFAVTARVRVWFIANRLCNRFGYQCITCYTDTRISYRIERIRGKS